MYPVSKRQGRKIIHFYYCESRGKSFYSFMKLVRLLRGGKSFPVFCNHQTEIRNKNNHRNLREKMEAYKCVDKMRRKI